MLPWAGAVCSILDWLRMGLVNKRQTVLPAAGRRRPESSGLYNTFPRLSGNDNKVCYSNRHDKADRARVHFTSRRAFPGFLGGLFLTPLYHLHPCRRAFAGMTAGSKITNRDDLFIVILALRECIVKTTGFLGGLFLTPLYHLHPCRRAFAGMTMGCCSGFPLCGLAAKPAPIIHNLR